MKNFRRKFLKLLGLSYLSLVLLPYNLLYSATKKIINPELTEEQKKIMFNESTERPFSSPLNNEKRKGVFIVLIVVQNFLRQMQNLIVAQVGHLLLSRLLAPSKLKLIIHLE